MRMHRTGMALILALSLLLLPLSLQPSAPMADAGSNPATVVDVTGTGFLEAFACAACAAGAAGIIAGGAGAVLVAVNSGGSFWVAGACVGACVAAFT